MGWRCRFGAIIASGLMHEKMSQEEFLKKKRTKDKS